MIPDASAPRLASARQRTWAVAGDERLHDGRGPAASALVDAGIPDAPFKPGGGLPDGATPAGAPAPRARLAGKGGAGSRQQPGRRGAAQGLPRRGGRRGAMDGLVAPGRLANTASDLRRSMDDHGTGAAGLAPRPPFASRCTDRSFQWM